MSKKFAEHNGLNLTQTNNDVLQMCLLALRDGT